MVLAVRRIHERMGARMEVLLQGVRRVYDSLLKHFVATKGPAAVAPSRKEPLDGPRLERIFSLPEGTTLGAKSCAGATGIGLHGAHFSPVALLLHSAKRSFCQLSTASVPPFSLALQCLG